MAWDDPTYKLEECCEQLKEELDEMGGTRDFIHRNDTVRIRLVHRYVGINYCPFCGQKINITSRPIYT